MEMHAAISATQWAERTYGSVMLGDQRRTQRAVKLASALAREPMASFPQLLREPGELKAAYRFLESPKISYQQLMQPHLTQTRTAMQEKKMLLIQDMTELEYDHHPATKGLGPVGRGKHHQGFLLQTVLAVDPSHREVVGLAAQEPLLRVPAPEGETSAQRIKRTNKETEVWQRQVESIGPAPAGGRWIHVGDRGSDIFSFLRACLRCSCGFVVRVKHDRRVDLRVEEAEAAVPTGARRRGDQRPAPYDKPLHLFEVVRSWPQRGQQVLHLDGNHKRRERDADRRISWGKLRLWPPDGEKVTGEKPLVVTVVRTWEPHPPQGATALEWLLLTSEGVENEQEAWERVEWYRMRWIVEDSHQCLKTGCQMEARQVRTYEGLKKVLGLLAPLAVRLLQLRGVARQDPQRAAQDVLPSAVVKVVAHLAHVPAETLTARHCWHQIAKAGGYLGRKGDGEPGWKTLWKGWHSIQTLLEGIQLASQLSLE